jgi:hypothetical protein
MNYLGKASAYSTIYQSVSTVLQEKQQMKGWVKDCKNKLNEMKVK